MPCSKAFFISPRFLVFGAFASSIALMGSQVHSLNDGSNSLEVVENNSVTSPFENTASSLVRNDFRPVPPNRLNFAKDSTDKDRNPFLVDSSLGVRGEASLSNAAIAAGLRSVRLTGLVQEGTALRALVDDGLTNSSLGVGDPFDFGSLHGLGFRLTSISFDQGAISISNGRVEHQIFAPQ